MRTIPMMVRGGGWTKSLETPPGLATMDVVILTSFHTRFVSNSVSLP